MTVTHVFSTALSAALVASAVAANLAAAQSGTPAIRLPPPVAAVNVHIGVILASNSGAGFDNRLISMKPQFDSFFSYSSYQLVEERRQRVPWGAAAEFDIAGGRHVTVTPRELKNERVVLKLVVVDGTRPVVDTLVALRDRGTFLLGGQRHEGGLIILAVGADYIP